tara:strand:- start:1752 stop:2525 length:774 start_codon:yes stop_codon:yes gene_type:complete
MSKFSITLKDSYNIFLQEPKFVLPKLIIALLNSILILLVADLAVQVFAEPTAELLISTIILFLATIIVSLADIFVGAMYPFMVEQVKSKKKLDLSKAFQSTLKKVGVIFPSIIAVEFGFLVLTFLISLPMSFLIISDEAYTIFFSGIYVVLLLGFVFLFYVLYPLLAYEKVSIKESLKRSIAFSLKNKNAVGKATILSSLLSLLSFAIAFSIELFPSGGESYLFWTAFIIVRFLTAYVYSYLFVLNPVFYLHYKAGK